MANKTPTQTISGSAPKALADRVQEIARMEDRSPSQVVVSAVDLYTRLPTEAHVALRRITALGGEAELERTLVDLGRQILDRQFDAARRAVAASMQMDVDSLDSDDDFLNAAADAVTRTREHWIPMESDDVTRICLDLNVWIADLLATRKGRVDTVAQTLVGVVRDGICALGPVQLVISWGMLDRLHLVLVRDFAVDTRLAQLLVNAIATIARKGPAQTAPYLLLGGTGVLPLRDPEDRGVLETAFAGEAHVLVTHNFRDFLGKDTMVLAPGEVAVARRVDRTVIVAVPSVMRRWIHHGAIELPT